MQAVAIQVKQTKICKVCGQEKPLSAFRQHAKMRDGRRNTCRKCQQEQQAKRQMETLSDNLKGILDLDYIRELGYELPKLSQKEKQKLWHDYKIRRIPRSELARNLGVSRTVLNFLIILIEEERSGKR